MKKQTIVLILLILVVGLLSYLAGCSLFGVSVDARVTQFLADINNASYDQVYLNFDPGIGNYAGIQVAAFWNSTYFPSGSIPYSIISLSTSDPANVTFTISGAGFVTKDVKFVMQKSGMDWMIIEMYMDVSPAVFGPGNLIVD